MILAQMLKNFITTIFGLLYKFPIAKYSNRACKATKEDSVMGDNWSRTSKVLPIPEILSMSKTVTGKNNILERKRARKQERGKKEEEEKGNSSIKETLSLAGKKQTNKKTLKKLKGK